MKRCPKSQRCSLGGRWKLHLALVDLDEHGIDVRIADVSSSPTAIASVMWGHDIIIKTPPVTLPTGAVIEKATLCLDIRPPISGTVITGNIQSVPAWNKT